MLSSPSLNTLSEPSRLPLSSPWQPQLRTFPSQYSKRKMRLIRCRHCRQTLNVAESQCCRCGGTPGYPCEHPDCIKLPAESIPPHIAMYTASSTYPASRRNESCFDINIGSPNPTKGVQRNSYKQGEEDPFTRPSQSSSKSNDDRMSSDGSDLFPSNTAMGLEISGAATIRHANAPGMTDPFEPSIPPRSSGSCSSHGSTSCWPDRPVTGFGEPYEDAIRQHERKTTSPTVTRYISDTPERANSLVGAAEHDDSHTCECGDLIADEGPSEPILAGWSPYSSSQDITYRDRSRIPTGRFPTICEKDAQR